MMKLFSIDGYWKDKGPGPEEGFHGYIVTEGEGCPAGIPNDQIFFHGLTEEELKASMEQKGAYPLEFVVTAYRPYEIDQGFLQPINTNALIGYKCPRCASPGPFEMTTLCMTPWDDEGTDFPGEPEIQPDGRAHCKECDYHGKVEEFDAEKHYVNRGGNHCPYCNAEDEHLETIGKMQVDGPNAWQEVRCIRCNATWQDLFKLVGLGNYPDNDFIETHNDDVMTPKMPCPECFKPNLPLDSLRGPTTCPDCGTEFEIIGERTVKYADE